jgi:hypothetical protein
MSEIQRLERKRVTLLKDVCEACITQAQENGPVSFLYPVPHDTPKYIIRTFREMHKRGLSLMIPVPDKKKSIENFPETVPKKVEELYFFDENNLYIQGNFLVDYLDSRLPGYKGTESGIFQGSAKLPCPENSDVKFAQELVEGGKYLIIGGMGMPGSAMERTITEYLELGGKGVIVIITKQLNRSGTKHQEALNFIANNVVILTADNLEIRIPGFVLSGTQGTLSGIKTLISFGGTGTKHEKELLEEYNDVEGYGGIEIVYSNVDLWRHAIEYDKLNKRSERVHSQLGLSKI